MSIVRQAPVRCANASRHHVLFGGNDRLLKWAVFCRTSYCTWQAAGGTLTHTASAGLSGFLVLVCRDCCLSCSIAGARTAQDRRWSGCPVCRPAGAGAGALPAARPCVPAVPGPERSQRQPPATPQAQGGSVGSGSSGLPVDAPAFTPVVQHAHGGELGAAQALAALAHAAAGSAGVHPGCGMRHTGAPES